MLAAAGFIPCLLLPILLVLGAVAIVAAVAAQRKRREAFVQLAAKLGLQFDPGPIPGFDRQYPMFECFQRGHTRRGINILSGPLPGEPALGSCVLGEYQFRETHSTGKSTYTVTYHFGFVIVTTRWPTLPDVLIRPEHLFDKLAGALGFDDIDFESAEFSRKWMVKSSDKRFAYDLIDARMMEFLMQGMTPSIDVGGGLVCFWYGQSKRLEPAQLEGLLGWAVSFLQRWPRVLVQELDQRHGTRTGSSEHA